jgi:hypothetical protein
LLVITSIQDLYSIHNPGHDNTRLLTKYRDSLEELLAAVRAKYEPVRMLAAVLPSKAAQLYQEAFFGEQRVGSEYLVAASSSGWRQDRAKQRQAESALPGGPASPRPECSPR